MSMDSFTSPSVVENSRPLVSNSMPLPCTSKNNKLASSGGKAINPKRTKRSISQPASTLSSSFSFSSSSSVTANTDTATSQTMYPPPPPPSGQRPQLQRSMSSSSWSNNSQRASYDSSYSDASTLYARLTEASSNSPSQYQQQQHWSSYNGPLEQQPPTLQRPMTYQYGSEATQPHQQYHSSPPKQPSHPPPMPYNHPMAQQPPVSASKLSNTPYSNDSTSKAANSFNNMWYKMQRSGPFAMDGYYSDFAHPQPDPRYNTSLAASHPPPADVQHYNPHSNRNNFNNNSNNTNNHHHHISDSAAQRALQAESTTMWRPWTVY